MFFSLLFSKRRLLFKILIINALSFYLAKCQRLWHFDMQNAKTKSIFLCIRRSLISHSKFYYFDVGVFRQLRPRGILDREAELEGPALEGLVAQHLRAWVQSQKETHQLTFWRTRTGLEVDFVIYGPQGFWAIEVQRGKIFSPSDINGLKAFQEEYPEATCCVLYTGKQRTTYRNFLCIPVDEFLLKLKLDAPVVF